MSPDGIHFIDKGIQLVTHQGSAATSFEDFGGFSIDGMVAKDLDLLDVYRYFIEGMDE